MIIKNNIMKWGYKFEKDSRYCIWDIWYLTSWARMDLIQWAKKQFDKVIVIVSGYKDDRGSILVLI